MLIKPYLMSLRTVNKRSFSAIGLWVSSYVMTDKQHKEVTKATSDEPDLFTQ